MSHEQNADGTVSVEFRLPLDAGANSVAVAGEFNDWSRDSHVMHQGPDGDFSIVITLPAGRRYRYRYWIDGEDWVNDWTADDYVPNAFGGDDCVVDLTDVTDPAPTNPD